MLENRVARCSLNSDLNGTQRSLGTTALVDIVIETRTSFLLEVKKSSFAILNIKNSFCHFLVQVGKFESLCDKQLNTEYHTNLSENLLLCKMSFSDKHTHCLHLCKFKRSKINYVNNLIHVCSIQVKVAEG